MRSRSSVRFLITVTLAAGLVATVGCKSKSAPRVDATVATEAKTRAATTASGDEIDPIAARLCGVLYTLPSERKAACCHSKDTGTTAADCARALSASIRSGAVAISEGRVAACEADMRAALVGCDWVKPGLATPPKSCVALVEGRGASGARCNSDLECTSGLHCGARGACVDPEPNGERCGHGVDTLAAQVRQYGAERAHPVCAGACSRVTHRCEDAPAVGTACFSNAACGDDLLCVEGRCAALAAAKVGAPCAGGAQGTCELGARCVAGTCAPLAAAGESCKTDLDCAAGGCTTQGSAPDQAGRRVCAMTCSHAADLPTILAAIQRAPTAPPARR